MRHVNRLSDRPIIHSGLDTRIGTNINGPSVIRMPDWASGRLGTYHCYFADHRGTFIRLAYADAIEGPWHVHRPGVLDVADSLFEPVDPPEPPEDQRPFWASNLKGGYLYAHVASPDVHVDHEARTIRMYYHGLLANGDQLTRLANSADGLTFRPMPDLLGPPYFRAFRCDGMVYAVSWGGVLWRSRSWEGPFERGPVLVPKITREGIDVIARHFAVHVVDNTLHLYYSNIGDPCECLLHADVLLKGDWMSWRAGPASVVLMPELEWEGAFIAPAVSEMGTADDPVCQLRDPYFFEDADGRNYLFYSGAGERAIGVAAVTDPRAGA